MRRLGHNWRIKRTIRLLKGSPAQLINPAICIPLFVRVVLRDTGVWLNQWDSPRVMAGTNTAIYLAQGYGAVRGAWRGQEMSEVVNRDTQPTRDRRYWTKTKTLGIWSIIKTEKRVLQEVFNEINAECLDSDRIWPARGDIYIVGCDCFRHLVTPRDSRDRVRKDANITSLIKPRLCLRCMTQQFKTIQRIPSHQTPRTNPIHSVHHPTHPQHHTWRCSHTTNNNTYDTTAKTLNSTH